MQGNFDAELLKQKKSSPFFDDPETSHLLMNSNLDSDTEGRLFKGRLT